MKMSSGAKLAAAFLACACAPCAWAQEPASKGAEATVRERRATAAEAPKGAPQSDEDAAAEASDTKAAAETAGAPADEAQSPAERARQRLSSAERLAESGNRAEAVALLRSTLAEDRFDPALFYNTGNALARMGETEAAVEAYRKAVAQRRGNYARAQHNLGVVLTRLGRWDEAEEALTAALKLESFNYAEASYSLGRLHALRGESGLAVAEWTRTLRLKPDHVDAGVSLARLLAEGGDTSQALAVLDALGERLKRRGDDDGGRAVAAARGEIVADSNLPAPPAGAPRARPAEGVRGEEKGAGLGDADGDSVLVIAKRDGGAPASAALRDSDASAVLRNARSASTRPLVATRDALDFLRRARVAREGGRGEDALALYRRAVESNGGYFAPANLELGYTLADLRRNDEAAASVLSVIRHDGARYPVAFYHVGRLYEHVGRIAEAEEAFARAAELMGDSSPQFYVDLSRVRERGGDYAGALAAEEEYVRLASRTGGAPVWALARVEQLRKKAAQATPQAAPVKN